MVDRIPARRIHLFWLPQIGRPSGLVGFYIADDYLVDPLTLKGFPLPLKSANLLILPKVF
jgi:hypothetical protein